MNSILHGPKPILIKCIIEMFIKYPRTPHLVGSNLQQGDTIDGQIPVEDLTIGELIWEEKLDGSNTGISFINGELQLQSRGHILTGGSREAQFNMFKKWASVYEMELYEILHERYIMYGEWYDAYITIKSFDIDKSTILKQNKNRNNSVPEPIIMNLARKWEPPSILEAHQIEWISNERNLFI
jgi:hypothetical protein